MLVEVAILIPTVYLRHRCCPQNQPPVNSLIKLGNHFLSLEVAVSQRPKRP